MFFNKYPHPANFSFARSFNDKSKTLLAGHSELRLTQETFAGDIYNLSFQCPDRWSAPRHVIELNKPEVSSHSGVQIDPEGGLTFANEDGRTFLSTVAGQSIGVSKSAWLMCFEVPEETRFFGMGEKLYGKLELSGIRAKFWNTDVWSDFHFAQWLDHPADPPYLSVPYVVIETEHGFTGILVHSTAAAFIETPGNDETRVFVEWQRTAPYLIVGAEGGEPDVWIVHGPDLKSVTRKLQKLVGVTPRPPLWALGYHQSRWGYAGEKDLESLHAKFKSHKIPCDGLWLDIDYMLGYRVFTIDPDLFPSGTANSLGRLRSENRKVVAILDPGVKREPGYHAYDELIECGAYCENSEGNPFVGLVWPGETIYPDFTMSEGRAWWSGQVQKLTESGISAYWIDMNDPSTGPVDPHDMLFNKGSDRHVDFRNVYALGMQKATFEGLLAARPNERPFILSRSGSQGSSRYAAIWTGDNVANEFYLRLSVPTTLNLSLSGIPFNGPDLGGFGGDTGEELMLAWMKACVLFPFTRSHTGKDTRDQEPWAYSADAQEILTHYIKLRYRLLPYLYNLFIQQERAGDPILRPLNYEFPETKSGLDDQFFVGNAVLHAPVLSSKKSARKVALPKGVSWFDARDGSWMNGKKFNTICAPDETPLFLRNGAIVPVAAKSDLTQPINLRQVDFHLFVCPNTSGSSAYTYRFDDGISYDYQRGACSAMEIRAEWDSTAIKVTMSRLQTGFGELEARIVVYGDHEISINGAVPDSESSSITWTGKVIPTRSFPTARTESAVVETSGVEASSKST